MLQEMAWRSQLEQGPPIPCSLLTNASLKWRRKKSRQEKQVFLEIQPLLDTDVALTLEEAVLECLCAHSLPQLRQHLLSTSAVAATDCLGTMHHVVQLFAWVVNSRARLANSEGLFCHSESNHRGNSIMRKPRHTFHHLAALLCLLFLPRSPSSPLSLLFFLSFLFFITHISSFVTHIILFAPSLTPFLSFPLSPGFSLAMSLGKAFC